MNKKKNICLLGCAGFIGSHLIERLLICGSYRLFGLDRETEKIDRFITHPSFTFIKQDVHELTKVMPYIQQADMVISLAALCNPSLYNTIPLEVIGSNFIYPLEMFIVNGIEKNKRTSYKKNNKNYIAGKLPFSENGNSKIILEKSCNDKNKTNNDQQK